MGRLRDAGNDEESEPGIDMSPMMDCIFILLIFFIVTTTFVEESGVEVDKPQAASAASLEKTSIIIAITAAGDVIYGGKSIGVGGVQSLVRRSVQKEQVPVIIQADSATQSGQLVRVIDEAKLGGAEKVSIATAAGRG